MSTTTDASGDEFARRLEKIIPHEMEGKAFYLIETLPPAYARYSRKDDHTLALVSPLADVACEQQLRDAGRWKGRGFAIMFPRPELFRAMPEQRQWGTVIHEMAHIIDDYDYWAMGNDPVVQQRETTRDPITSTATEFRRQSRTPFFQDHEAKWIRAAIHLQRRSVMHGWPIALDDMTVAGLGYGLSPADTYADALGDEPERCINEPLSSVIKTDTPKRFRELWTRDLERWIEIEADALRFEAELVAQYEQENAAKNAA